MAPPNVLGARPSIEHRSLACRTTGSCLTWLLVWNSWLPCSEAGELVHFALAREGSCTLVMQDSKDGGRRAFLIDVGPSGGALDDQQTPTLREYLNKRGIQSLDAVI